MFCSLCGFSVAWFRSLWSYTVCDCFFSFRNLRGRKRNLSLIILWGERSCRMTGYLTNFVRCDSFPFIQWFWARTEEKVSRLIGTHQLIHLNYYPYIARLKNISLLITLRITFIFCASCSWDGSPRLPGARPEGDHQQLCHGEEFFWGDGCWSQRCQGIVRQVGCHTLGLQHNPQFGPGVLWSWLRTCWGTWLSTRPTRTRR